jgi:tripartite-type tricarboxylate transporter receptor subunit TctC
MLPPALDSPTRSIAQRFILRSRFAARLLTVSILVPGASVVSAQGYPNKPIRFIVSDVGGGNDFAARMIGPGLTASLNQQVVIENRGGAGGAIAIESVAKAPADGYTLLLYSNAMWTLPLLKKVPFDPIRDFAPISLAAMAPSILVVHPALPVKSVKELIGLARARPGDLNYGSVGPGTPNQIAAELFKSMAGGLKIEEVTFKGGGPAVIALLGGQVQLMFGSAAAVAPHMSSGRLRALAITSAEPSRLLPGMPTMASAGLPGYDEVTLFCVFAPAKTPSAIIDLLNREIVQVVGMAEVKQRFFASGIDVVGSSPEQLAARVRGEMSKVARIIRDANIRAD